MNFGNGPTLKEASPYLRDDEARIERILTVAATDSVIEGLPPFDKATRERLRRDLLGGRWAGETNSSGDRCKMGQAERRSAEAGPNPGW